MQRKTVVLSVGGSIVSPHDGDGVVIVKRLRTMLFAFVKKGYQFVIVVGGGAPARDFQGRLKKLGIKDDKSLDWMGIFATHLNARYFGRVLYPHAKSKIVTDPVKHKKTSDAIVIAGGHKPGASTDHVAAQLAKKYGASYMVNLSNVSYIYSADPRKVKNAKRYVALNWKQMQKIVGTKWSPGLHTPFDPIATKVCRKNDIDVAVIGGDKLGELKNLLSGKKFKGTWISSKVLD